MGDGEIVSMFECLACGGFDSHARGDARQDDTSHSAAAQLQVEVGSKKRAPLAFGDQDVTGLLVEPIIEFGVVRREWPGRARTGDAEAQAIWCGKYRQLAGCQLAEQANQCKKERRNRSHGESVRTI